MDHDQRLFFSELSTVILIFILALLDYDKLYLFMENCYVSIIRFIETVKFKVWLSKEGITRHKK